MIGTFPNFRPRRVAVGFLWILIAPCGVGGCGNSDSVNQSQFVTNVEEAGGEIQIYLDFDETAITDDDLLSLPFPDNVRSISLQGTAITDRGVRELRRANNLSVVDLRNTPTTDKAVDTLMQMPRLWRAVIASPDISTEKQRELSRFLSRQSTKLSH